MQKQTFSTEAIDAAKGFLILLIVLGHNAWLSSDFRPAYLAIYSFHVTAFFLLSAVLSKPRAIDTAFIRDRAVRYLVPFTIFFLFYAALFTIMKSPVGIAEWLERTLIGWGVASSRTLDMATDQKRLWFLPALFTFVLAFTWLLPKKNKVIYITLFLLHGLVGLSPLWLKTYAPFGILIVLNVMVLAFIARDILNHPKVKLTLPVGFILLGLWLALAYVAYILKGYTTLADIDVYAWDKPVMLVLYDLLALLGFFMVFALSPLLAKIPGMVFCGKESLLIYLVHGLVFFFVRKIVEKVGMDGFAALGISFALTIAGCVVIVFCFRLVPLVNQLVFPRDWPSLKQALQR